jgi:DtxR family Mn-dependent transcriptional regulator
MAGDRKKEPRNPSVSRENYLKFILEMQQEGVVPISARLSEELHVTPPAVTAALKRLSRDGYVVVDRDGRIKLTARGARIANSLVVRHRLAEKLLTEVLGMKWSTVHEEAEKLEHAISPELERHLLKYFGRNGYCPHGNPLFGGLTRLKRMKTAVRLADVKPPATVEVLRVHEMDRRFLEFLSGLNIFPNTRLKVRSVGYDRTMLLHNGRKTMHLSENATSRIWVKVSAS